MSNSIETKTPVWFWLVSLLALVWYLFGVFQFYTSISMSVASLAPMVEAGQMTQAYADFIVAMPIYIKVLFGTATIGGTLACIFLLLRKAGAKSLFIISLFGAILMYVFLYGFGTELDIIPSADFIIAGVVMLVTLLMIIFSSRMQRHGVLS
jgi:hypothetical protein